MALTINTLPAKISNSALFNVTTSHVEDSTHVNLRIRAEVYHEGIVKAVVEKPKGLADFNFNDILKSLCPGLLFPRDSGDLVKTGSIGSNLITGWSVHSGSWDTFTSSGAQVTGAIEASTSPVYIKTNAISMTIGDLYLLYSPDFATSGVNRPYGELLSGQNGAEDIYNNKGILIMPTTTGLQDIYIGHLTGQMNFTGTFYLYKITTNRLTVGNPLTPYFIKFTEVFENSSGVTTTDATDSTVVFRYVPARGDGISFTEYVLHDNACLFACKTFKNNVTKVYSNTPYEYLITFFTEYVNLDFYYSKDGGAYDHATHPVCYEGWGVIVLNAGELLSSVTTSLAMYFKELSGGATISSVLTAYVDSSCINERYVLEFDGLVGGKEYLPFEGIEDKQFTTIREYLVGVKKNRKPISFTGVNKQKLETRFKDIANSEYLKSLLISEDVKRLEASYAAPTEVTIVSDSVRISSSELFTNQIEIEYEY